MDFRVIICGGRDFSNYDLLKERCDYYLQNKKECNIIIVCGKARGADTLGEQYANERGYAIEYYPADWDKFGKSAGFIRNKEMVDVADEVIAFWDGASHGTKHTIDIANEKGINVKVVHYE